MIVDKINFYSYLEKMLPGFTPKVRAILSRNDLYFPLLEFKAPAQALLNLPDGKYVCKPARGTMGTGIFIFSKSGRHFCISGEKVSVDELLGKLGTFTRYIIQDFVHQHDAMSRVAPSSLNTIRVETVRWKKATHIHYALARFSAKEGVNVDNATQGGTFVGIDIDKGVLREFGEYFQFEDGAHEHQHPLSGIVYQGYQIPFWEEIVDLVKVLHPLFYGLVSVGWDIAITEDGPVVLEGNTSPCSKMAQMANGGLKKRWNRWKNSD